MIAAGSVVVEAGPDGEPRYTRLRSAAPLLLRPTPTGLYLLGGAAGPIAGDQIYFDVRVGPGASLTVCSVAATVARPGPGASDWSRLRVVVDVAAKASLHWLTEPGLASAGCRHSVDVTISLGAGATLVWREEVVLGRHGEDPGSWSSALRVDLEGRALLRQRLDLGPHAPGWAGPAVAGGARAVGSLLVVDPATTSLPVPPAICGGRIRVMALAGAGLIVSALAPSAIGLRRTLDSGFDKRSPAGRRPRP